MRGESDDVARLESGTLGRAPCGIPQRAVGIRLEINRAANDAPKRGIHHVSIAEIVRRADIGEADGIAMADGGKVGRADSAGQATRERTRELRGLCLFRKVSVHG